MSKEFTLGSISFPDRKQQQQQQHHHHHHNLKHMNKYENYFHRSELNQEQLENRYKFNNFESENVLKSAKKYLIKKYKPSRSCMQNYLLDRVPFFRWIAVYDYRQNLFKDFIAGLTIGIIQIPQGMAYALMAGLPPIVGLYVSFFTVVIYVLLGTSKHLSLGIYAIISLMTKAATDNLEGKLYPDASELAHLNMKSNGTASINSTFTLNPDYLSEDPMTAKIMIGMSLAFYSGIIQILFAILHVGFVTKYLSDVIVAAFTTGAAYHIVVSQINILLGIKLGNFELPFKLIGDFIQIFSHIKQTNIATLVISLISMVFLYCVKHFVNERYKEKMIAPIPVDLIVVVLGTVLSYVLKFKERWNVVIVGDIPLGIPKPQVPPLHIFPLIIGDSISIAIVSFAINISMAKLFAKKYKYKLDANQELFAYGVGNFVSAFFRGFPSCVGLSRSVILDGVGGKTQVYSIIASVLVLIVILAIGPLFRTLPNSCLGAIIVVALISLIIEVRQFWVILKRSKFEALAWAVTFLGVVILDVDYGLYIGLCFSLLLVIAQSQRALTSVLGNIPYTDLYESIDICAEAKEFENIRIIRYESSVYYANVENFIYKIIKLSRVDPADITAKIHKERKKHEKLINSYKSNRLLSKFFKFKKNSETIAEVNEPDLPALEKELNDRIQEILDTVPIKNVVLDFSCINFIDSMGVNAIQQLNDSFKEVGATLHLTYCKRCVLRTFEKNSLKEKFDYEHIYPTTHDAVLSILRNNQMNIRLISEKRNSSINIHIDEIIKRHNHIEGDNEITPVYKPTRRHSNIFDDITLIKTDLPTIEETENAFTQDKF